MRLTAGFVMLLALLSSCSSTEKGQAPSPSTSVKKCDFSTYNPVRLSHFIPGAVVRNVLPEYPVEAVKSGVEGEIQVEILVKDDGTVEKSCSSAIGPLGTAAESAALQWMFLNCLLYT